jgi:DNA modification methylase
VARSKTGDLYELGTHRLLCGDSTKKEDVDLLMDGNKANMVFTDPPYGVAIGDKNKLLDSIEKAGRITTNIKNDTLNIEELKKMLVEGFRLVKEYSQDICSYYVTAPQGGDLGMMMMEMMREAGLPVKHIIIWVKNRQCFSMGRLDYEYKHEPILYTWNKSHKFYGNGNHKNSVWEIDKEQKCDKHPTMKPVELIENAILNSSKKDSVHHRGGIILDAFLGSGSTLIACEKTNRKCYGMEIDPLYCDVIVQRYIDYTGNNSIKLNGEDLKW